MAKPNPKRMLLDTSPETGHESDLEKTKDTDFNMDKMLAGFGALLESKLDEKLKDVATKADIESFRDEIKELKHQNAKMREEIQSLEKSEKTLRDRLEHLEKHQKRNNILVTGLKGNSIEEIRKSFCEIYEKVLKVDITVGFITKINSPGVTSKCIIELSSPAEVGLVLKKCKLLKNTNVFVQKDLTKTERNQNYHLRRIKKYVGKQDENCKVVGTTLFVRGKKFKCSETGDITAANITDCDLLKEMLRMAGVGDQYNVISIAKPGSSD